MSKRNLILLSSLVAVALVVGGIVFALNQATKTPNTNAGTTTPQTLGDEHINEEIVRQQESLSIQPNINEEEFILTAADITCPLTEVNGIVGNNCNGNIHIVPKANDAMGEGLYKINEQTKLLRGGQEQMVVDLEQLSRSQTTVRLTLVSGSDEMLAEVRYQ